jgi:hypothetical protein
LIRGFGLEIYVVLLVEDNLFSWTSINYAETKTTKRYFASVMATGFLIGRDLSNVFMERIIGNSWRLHQKSPPTRNPQKTKTYLFDQTWPKVLPVEMEVSFSSQTYSRGRTTIIFWLGARRC